MAESNSKDRKLDFYRKLVICYSLLLRNLNDRLDGKYVKKNLEII